MQDDLGKLILRLAVGGLLLLHGVHKMLTGIAPIEAMVVARPIPVRAPVMSTIGTVSGEFGMGFPS